MDPPSLRELSFGTLGVEAVLCAVAIALAWFSRRRLGERLGLGRGTLAAPKWFHATIGAVALSFALDGIIESAGLREGTPLEEFAELVSGARGLDLALALIALGLAPGFAEELLCRGLVQRGLEASLGPAAALLVAALFFGMIHVDPVHGGFAVVLGLYLGCVAARANSIWPAIVCHASNNLLAVYFAARWPELSPPGPLGISLAFAVALTCLWSTCQPWPSRSSLQTEGGSDEL